MRKIKSIKRMAIVLMLILLSGTFSGCGKSDNAPQCLKACLDNELKGDTKAVVGLNLALSESAAADAYDDSIDAQLNALFSSFNISKELRKDFWEILLEINANTKYEVGDFTEQEDGSCVVTVTYEQLQVFEPAMEDALEAYDKVFQSWKEDPSSAVQSDEEMEERFFTLLRGSLKKMLVNVKYKEPAETTITVVKAADKCYVPKRQDLDDLKLEFMDKWDEDKLPSFDITDIYDFDAALYVQSYLDLRYKNESEAFCEVSGVSAAEAHLIYELSIAFELTNIMSESEDGVSEELLEDFWKLLEEMHSKARYTVGEAKRQKDGSYTVQVTYEQMQVYEPMLAGTKEILTPKMAEWKANPALYPDDAAMTELILTAMRDSLQKVLSDVEYNEPETLTVTLEPKGEGYIINEYDQLMLLDQLFDHSL